MEAEAFSAPNAEPSLCSEPDTTEALEAIQEVSGAARETVSCAWQSLPADLTVDERATSCLLAVLERSKQASVKSKVWSLGKIKATWLNSISAAIKPTDEHAMTEDSAQSQILDMFPGIQPDFARQALVRNDWASKSITDRLAHAVHYIASLEDKWPKLEQSVVVSKKRHRQLSEEEEQEEADEADRERYLMPSADKAVDAFYQEACLASLLDDFPDIPKPQCATCSLALAMLKSDSIDKTAKKHRYFWTPTYRALKHQRKLDDEERPFAFLQNARSSKGKGKTSIELERERAWYKRCCARAKAKRVADRAQEQQDERDVAAGRSFSCGCCYGDFPLRRVVRCADGHTLCNDCVRQHVEVRVGDRRGNVGCCDVDSECTSIFPDSELVRCLDERLMKLLDRIRQRAALEAAGLLDLEECTGCDYACIIDNPNERLFRCQNEDCGKVFCRTCKETDHLPLSCSEAKAAKKDAADKPARDALHGVAEAMSDALIRECPYAGCGMRYVKEYGCNMVRGLKAAILRVMNADIDQIYCSKCHGPSCYICGKALDENHKTDCYSVNAQKHVDRQIEKARREAAAKVQESKAPVTKKQLDAMRTKKAITGTQPPVSQEISDTFRGLGMPRAIRPGPQPPELRAILEQRTNAALARSNMPNFNVQGLMQPPRPSRQLAAEEQRVDELIAQSGMRNLRTGPFAEADPLASSSANPWAGGQRLGG